MKQIDLLAEAIAKRLLEEVDWDEMASLWTKDLGWEEGSKEFNELKPYLKGFLEKWKPSALNKINWVEDLPDALQVLMERNHPKVEEVMKFIWKVYNLKLPRDIKKTQDYLMLKQLFDHEWDLSWDETQKEFLTYFSNINTKLFLEKNDLWAKIQDLILKYMQKLGIKIDEVNGSVVLFENKLLGEKFFKAQKIDYEKEAESLVEFYLGFEKGTTKYQVAKEKVWGILEKWKPKHYAVAYDGYEIINVIRDKDISKAAKMIKFLYLALKKNLPDFLLYSTDLYNMKLLVENDAIKSPRGQEEFLSRYDDILSVLRKHNRQDLIKKFNDMIYEYAKKLGFKMEKVYHTYLIFDL